MSGANGEWRNLDSAPKYRYVTVRNAAGRRFDAKHWLHPEFKAWVWTDLDGLLRDPVEWLDETQRTTEGR